MMSTLNPKGPDAFRYLVDMHNIHILKEDAEIQLNTESWSYSKLNLMIYN